MFHKLFVFLLVASFLISACGNMPPIPISCTPTSAATLTPSATVTPTPAPSSTLTQTLTPSPTPLPVFIRGEFEYDFQSGVVPAELVAGGLGEVTFGIAQSAGGEISTEGMKSQNIIPLVKDGAVLNAVSGNVVFLPFPEKMLTEDGQEVSYSKDQSGQGWAAYTDASGNVLRKMITRIPNAATIVAGVSFNSSDRGTVYAVKLSASGEVQGKARLVFDDQTALSVVFASGEVAIDVGGQPSIPNFQAGNWEKDALRELDAKLAAAGVVFTPDTTTVLETEYYKYTYRLSKGILARSGERYVKIPPDRLDLMYSWTVAKFMFVQRNNYPDRYNEFFVRQGDWQYQETYEFATLAKENFKQGPAPIKFNNGSLGSFNELEMNFVSKAEFLDIVIPALQALGVTYSVKPPWAVPGADQDIAAFISGNKLITFYYDRKPGERNRQPIELASDRETMYFSLFIACLGTTTYTMINLTTNFEWSNVFPGGIFCGINNTNKGLVEFCRPYINYTFNRGAPLPPSLLP